MLRHPQKHRPKAKQEQHHQWVDSESVGGGVKVRLASKVKALELLGRHLGLFVDRMEHSGPDGGPIRATVDMSDEELEAIAGGG
jgi:F0F1-type ATP synthase assembly protein I